MAAFTALRRVLREARQMLRPETYRKGRELQERLDTLRLYLLTEAHRSWPDVRIRTLDDVEDTAPRMHQQTTVLQSNVTAQIVQMLGAWRVEQPPPMPPDVPLDDDVPADVAESLAELRDAIVAQYEAELREAQHRAFGFCVRVKPSGANTAEAGGAGAGEGVFIEGKARMGSVLAIYPGVVFYPSDIVKLVEGVERFKGNEYLILRYDQTLIDASPQTLELVPGSNSTACPLAVAQRTNHPPAGHDANALACALNLQVSDLPEELHGMLPYVRFEQVEWQMLHAGGNDEGETRLLGTPLGGGPFAALDRMLRFSISEMGAADAQDDQPLRCLVFVAARDIEDEEVFFNYRLNPATRETWPKWYVPYAEEEAVRRWS